MTYNVLMGTLNPIRSLTHTHSLVTARNDAFSVVFGL